MKKLMPLIIAVVAAVIYMMILSANQKRFQEDSKLESVVVAVRNLPERKVIARGDLSYVQIPSKYVQKDAYRYTKDSDITKLENNLVTKIAVSAGNQLTTNALTSLSADAGLSSVVPPLWRGFVLTGVETSVANLVKPGDWVDVLLTFEVNMKNTGQRERITATILQRIKVLGVGNDLGQGLDAGTLKNNKDRDASANAFNDSSAISLALDPRDAQYLALAKEEGKVDLVIRNASNTGIHSIPIASLTEMFK